MVQFCFVMPLKWYQRMPIVNLGYDLLFDEPPSVVNIERLLNVYGLVSALLLSIIFSVVGSVSVGELEQADQRYFEAAKAGHCWYAEGEDWRYNAIGFSHRLAVLYNMAVIFVSAALVSTVLVFMCFSSHDYDNDKPSYDRWWFYGRWPVTIIFLCLIAGCFYVLAAFDCLAQMRFPSYPCMRTEDTLAFYSREKGMIAGIKFDKLNQFGIISIMFITLFFMSAAAKNRYELEDSPSAVDEVDGAAKSTGAGI